MTGTLITHAGNLTLLVALGCGPSTATPTAEIYFPDEVMGSIPYRGGGQFVAGVHTGIDQLIGNTHAFITLDSSTGSGGNSGAQPVTLQPGDGGLGGTTVLTWPAGGDVVIHASVAGVTVADRTAHLVKPALAFHQVAISDSGTQWVYSYCLESSMADGMIGVHLDQATFTGGSADMTLNLIAGPCEGVTPSLPNLHSHATYTVTPSSASFRATASYAAASLVVAEPDVVVPPHASPAIQIDSPQTVFPVLSIVELQLHAHVGATPVAGASITLQSIPPTSLLPMTAVTDAAGNATAHFQMPASGPIEIDASIGAIRQVRVFSP
jgi:hypothetical protein